MEHDTSCQMYVTHMHSTITTLIFFKVVKVDPNILVIRWPDRGPIQFNALSG